MLPEFLWSRYFIEAQGFEVDGAVMYQENLSTFLLKNNGRLSSGNGKKHIRVRYFPIKYIIAMGDLKVKYCLTGIFCPATIPNHCKGLPSVNSELRSR